MNISKYMKLFFFVSLVFLSFVSNAEMVVLENNSSAPVHITFAGPVSGKISNGELGYKWRFTAIVNDKKIRQVEFYLRMVGGGAQKLFKVESPFTGARSSISWETELEPINSKTADWLRSDGLTEFVILAVYQYRKDDGGGVTAPMSFTTESKKSFIENALETHKFNSAP